METKEQSAVKALQKDKIVGWISLAFLPVALAFCEIILKATSGEKFTMSTTVGIILASFALGMIFNLICLIPPSKKVSGWLCYAITEISTIVFLLMYFINDSFRFYMDPVSIVLGTGNAVTSFFSSIMVVIGHGFPMILLYHVPAFVILYFAIRGEISLTHKGKWQPIASAALAAVFAVSAPLLMTAEKENRQKYTSEYSFDTTTRTFGLITSIKLDAVYRIFGNPFDTIDIEIAHIPDDGAKLWETDHAIPDKTDPSTNVGTDPDTPDGADRPTDDPTQEPDPATEPTPISEQEYGRNVMDIDFDSLTSGTNDTTLGIMFRYAASLNPSRKNEFTGLFEGKNLILITAEAFSKEVIDEELTPTLYRMANKGIVFEDYYQPAWGGSTSTGEFSIITGIIPANKIFSVKQTIGYDLRFTMGNQLMQLGYESGAYHNGSYTYYDRHLTHMNYGYSEFIGMGNGMEKGVTEQWPESDAEMFSYIMPKYIESGKPFSLYFMTVSGHCVYNVSGNSMSRKNYDMYASTDASETIKCYLAANYELELAMQYLINALEEAGIADDTVIVISTDHYPYGLEESATWGTTQSFLPELYGFTPTYNDQRDHSALIIWSGCLEDLEEPIVVESPTYSIDIVPTLSNLFGVEYDSRLLVGRDVFSDAEPLVIWPDYSWKTDKGYYHAPTGTFIPADGESADNEYIESIKSIVRNKVSFSKALLNYDFMSYVFK